MRSDCNHLLRYFHNRFLYLTLLIVNGGHPDGRMDAAYSHEVEICPYIPEEPDRIMTDGGKGTLIQTTSGKQYFNIRMRFQNTYNGEAIRHYSKLELGRKAAGDSESRWSAIEDHHLTGMSHPQCFFCNNLLRFSFVVELVVEMMRGR